MKRAPCQRREWYLVLGATVLAGLAIGVPVWLASINAEPEWNFPAPKPLPVPNGYDYYVRAGKAFVAMVPPPDDVLEAKRLKLTPAEKSARYSLARHQQWLAVNKPALALLKQAMGLRCVKPPRKAGALAGMSDRADFRQLGRYIQVVAQTQLLAGNYVGASRSCIDLAHLARDCERGGDSLSGLTGSAIESLGETTWKEAIPHLNASQLKALAAAYAPFTQSDWTFADCLEAEKWDRLRLFRQVMVSNEWRSIYTMNETWTRNDMLSMRFRSKRAFCLNYSSWMDYLIARAKLPYGAPRPPRPTEKPDYLTALSIDSEWTFKEPFCSFTRHLTQRRFRLFHLYQEAYKRDHGTYPASLDQLGTALTRRQPDPFGKGQPFRYRLNGKKCTLWSLGPDGIDDSGRPANPRKPEVATADDKGDLAMVLGETAPPLAKPITQVARRRP